MSNINAFWPVVPEKMIFEDLSKLSIFCPSLGPKPKGASPFILTDPNPQKNNLSIVTS